MRAVVLLDAAPGYEASVEAVLRRVRGVVGVARTKQGNFDLACLVEVADARELDRLLHNPDAQRRAGDAAARGAGAGPPR